MRGRELFRKAQLYLIVTLGTYPASACTVAFMAPELLPYMWIFSVAFFALGCICLSIPSGLRRLAGGIGCLMFFLPVLLFPGECDRTFLVIFGVVYSLLLLWSLQIAGWDADRELAPGWLAACMSSLVLGCVLGYFDPLLAPVALGFRVSMFVFVFLVLCSLNRSSLVLAAGGKGSVPRKMRRKNSLLILGMFALAVLVALVPSVMNLLQWLLSLAKETVAQVQEIFPVETTVPETTVTVTTESAGGGGAGGLADGMPDGYTSPATYLIMTMIAWGTVIPVGIFILYKLGVVLWKYGQSLLDSTGNTTDDFEDEVTDIRDEVKPYIPTPKIREKTLPLKRLTPIQKIRHRYKQLQQKHPQWKGSSTARENLEEEAATLYEKARYSSHKVTEQDAENFKNMTK